MTRSSCNYELQRVMVTISGILKCFRKINILRHLHLAFTNENVYIRVGVFTFITSMFSFNVILEIQSCPWFACLQLNIALLDAFAFNL